VRATFAYARRQRTWFRKEAVSRRYEEAPAVDEAIAASGEILGARRASAG
jgi:tRNA A37 N6-isopentenylltransferase MiaA